MGMDFDGGVDAVLKGQGVHDFTFLGSVAVGFCLERFRHVEGIGKDFVEVTTVGFDVLGDIIVLRHSCVTSSFFIFKIEWELYEVREP